MTPGDHHRNDPGIERLGQSKGSGREGHLNTKDQTLGEDHQKTELTRWARLFDEGFIYDWNTCDWSCVRVLGPLAAAEGEACARQIAGWSRARNRWRRRAAGVGFVNLAPDGDDNFTGFTSMLLEVCDRTVQHDDRFAQTGTGWLLRELSRAEPDRVATFVGNHLAVMSREAVRMAVAKLSDADRNRLLVAHGASPPTSGGAARWGT
jgi:3-methyladenine DNA glycosylase AlkD